MRPLVTVDRSPIRRAIDRQVVLDTHRCGRGHRQREDWQCVLLARMGAVVGAQRALGTHEVGARPALRQSLIDLAAVCEVLAADLAEFAAASDVAVAGQTVAN
jgi:hypothetical protein